MKLFLNGSEFKDYLAITSGIFDEGSVNIPPRYRGKRIVVIVSSANPLPSDGKWEAQTAVGSRRVTIWRAVESEGLEGETVTTFRE